jgi:cell division protease FtsH
MKNAQKTFAFYVLGVVALLLLFNLYNHNRTQTIPDFDFPKLQQLAQEKKVKSVTIRLSANEIYGELNEEGAKQFNNARQFSLVAPSDSDETVKLLRAQGIEPRFEKGDSGVFYALFSVWFPLILLVGFGIFLFRQIQSGGGKAMSFGKSKARLIENKTKVTFQDVAGIEEAKDELAEIVQFLKDPKKFTRLGGRIPKGVLMVGPPGTGKTLLARAIAGEAGVPFFTISGSDFVEMFVGVGASRVRDLFEQGKKNAPCLIFIDEIDAVGRHRGAGLGGGHDEREQTLNQLLVEMDGFEGNDGVILIAATNRPDVLDPALLRPGRFDRRVIVNKPDLGGRKKILEVHVKKTPVASDVDIEKIARGTPGFAGADLENLVNEAALSAARHDRSKLTMEDFEYAKEKVIMGTERRSMVMSDEDKKITAYHEAGHALVGRLLPGTDPIHKVTIIPRGMAAGLTVTLPEKDEIHFTKMKAENWIAFAFGGRAAEEIIFKDFTTGAGNDIERATQMARRMVCEWGMSERLGPLAYERREGPVFLGMQQTGSREYSEAKAEEIDREVFRIITEGHEKALKILSENIGALHRLAQALLDLETIDGPEVDLLIKGGGAEELRAARGKKAQDMSQEQAAAREEERLKELKAAEEKARSSGGGEPMGTPGAAPA